MNKLFVVLVWVCFITICEIVTVESNGDIEESTVVCVTHTVMYFICTWQKIPQVIYTFEYRRIDRLQSKWKPSDVTLKYGVSNVLQASINDAVHVKYQVRVNGTGNDRNNTTILEFDFYKIMVPKIKYKSARTTTTSITLKWDEYEYTGYHLLFQIYYEDIGAIGKERSRTFNTTRKTITINELKAGWHYKIYVRGRYDKNGETFSEFKLIFNGTTKDSLPSSSVTQMALLRSDDGTITIAWENVPLENQNGRILGYLIYWTNESTNLENEDTKWYTINGNSKWYTINDIGSYNVCVSAYNSAGKGPVTCLTTEPKPTIPQRIKLNILWVFVLLLPVLVLGVIVYHKINASLNEYPEPKLPKKTFIGVEFPVLETEYFDDLCTKTSNKETNVQAQEDTKPSNIIENDFYFKTFFQPGHLDFSGKADEPRTSKTYSISDHYFSENMRWQSNAHTTNLPEKKYYFTSHNGNYVQNATIF